MIKKRKIRCVKKVSFIEDCHKYEKVFRKGDSIFVDGVSFRLSPVGLTELLDSCFPSGWRNSTTWLSLLDAAWRFWSCDFGAIHVLLSVERSCILHENIALWSWIANFIDREYHILYYGQNHYH